MMLAQLRYSGLLEVCRIRKLGFPIRRDFGDFLARYRCLAPGAADAQALCKAITDDLKLVPSTEFALGKVGAGTVV